jgi:uncharacterized glyoxalase superfamily protein PhnB
MSEKDCRAPKMPWLSPYLTVKDAAKSLEFYQKAFGFTERDTVLDDKGVIAHAEVQYKDAVIMFGPEGVYGGKTKAPATLGVSSAVSLYIYCEDVDARYKQAIEAGAQSVMAPTDTFYGDRVCKVTDIDGHAWNFATFIGTPSTFLA